MIVVDHAVGEWVCKQTGGIYSPEVSFSIGRVVDKVLVGGVVYDHFNGRSVCMHCAGYGAWLSRQFLGVVFDYAFNQLKVNKVLGLVDSENDKAKRLDEHLGFVCESVIPEAGKEGDLMIYTMTRDQCRFLKGKYGQQ